MFNTKTKTWELVQPEKGKFNPRDMEGKIYITHDKTAVALNPKKWVWETLGRLDTDMDLELDRGSVCTTGNIIYTYSSREQFQWSYTRLASRRKIEGLEGIPNCADYGTVKLANYGGKLVVFWDKSLPASGDEEKMIWCAVISLEKRSSQEIWGKVEWFDPVLTVPKSYKFTYAIAATV